MHGSGNYKHLYVEKFIPGMFPAGFISGKSGILKLGPREFSPFPFDIHRQLCLQHLIKCLDSTPSLALRSLGVL